MDRIDIDVSNLSLERNYTKDIAMRIELNPEDPFLKAHNNDYEFTLDSIIANCINK